MRISLQPKPSTNAKRNGILQLLVELRYFSAIVQPSHHFRRTPLRMQSTRRTVRDVTQTKRHTASRRFAFEAKMVFDISPSLPPSQFQLYNSLDLSQSKKENTTRQARERSLPVLQCDGSRGGRGILGLTAVGHQTRDALVVTAQRFALLIAGKNEARRLPLPSSCPAQDQPRSCTSSDSTTHKFSPGPAQVQDIAPRAASSSLRWRTSSRPRGGAEGGRAGGRARGREGAGIHARERT